MNIRVLSVPDEAYGVSHFHVRYNDTEAAIINAEPTADELLEAFRAVAHAAVAEAIAEQIRVDSTPST